MHRFLLITGGLLIFITTATIAALTLEALSSPKPHNGSIAAFDSANIISDPLWFKKAYKDGFRLYILHSTSWGTCRAWPEAQKQAQMALDAGIAIAAYTRDPRCFKEGIQALGPLKDKLQFFALDIETDPGIPLSQSMIDGVEALGVRPVVYTGSGMWPEIMKGSYEYQNIPLWDTDTSNFSFSQWNIDYLYPSPKQYGGWNTESTMRIGVQQQFEYDLHGVKVDLNSFRASFVSQ